MSGWEEALAVGILARAVVGEVGGAEGYGGGVRRRKRDEGGSGMAGKEVELGGRGGGGGEERGWGREGRNGALEEGGR